MSTRRDMSVGVIGAGTMGVGIAYVFALVGRTVTIVEPRPDQQDRARALVETQVGKAVERGKLSAADAAEMPARIRYAADVAELASGLPLIVEAVPEQVTLKRLVLAAAEAREPAVLASNTSGLGIGELAQGLARPDRLVGMHFFNPVWAMPLVEIVRGEQTSDSAIDAACAAAVEIGKETIVVRDKPGFATSRLGIAIGLEAIRMLEDGVASAADIDRAMELGYRHPMGPLRLSDIVGLDVRLDIARHLSQTYGERFAPPQLLVDKVAAGELGRKTGRGFYDWESA